MKIIPLTPLTMTIKEMKTLTPMADIFQKYIDVMSDADYATKIQPVYTENMERLDKLSTKNENIKQMDPDPKDNFDLVIEYTEKIK